MAPDSSGAGAAQQLERDVVAGERSDAEVLARVRARFEAAGCRLAVVDDDPTGTQTVRDVPLITSWDDAELDWALDAASPTFAVLTNGRARDERVAAAANVEIGEGLARMAARRGVDLRVISRSDSTLRGHFPAEPEALAEGLRRGGTETDCVLVCPAYPEAGRVTADDVHRVGSVPVADTEFARDPAFGFRSSDLTEWVRERAGAVATVASVTLEDVRDGGADGVASRLLQARGRVRYVVVNATETSDLETVALGVDLAERRGMRLVYRTGPSFVSARTGAATAEPLTSAEIGVAGGRGLLVVGSHTALSTAQLERARQTRALGVVELDARRLLDGDRSALGEAVAALRDALAAGDAALVTSRRSAHVTTGADSLQTTAMVADGLVEVVRAVALEVPLDWLVAKGGITSHDMAVRALGTRRATVLGQLFRGKVSVWALGEGSLRPGLRYVVFAGNVGDEDTLVAALDRIAGAA